MENSAPYHLSYWERASFLSDVDVLIIGSGIVGLSAAIQLIERSSQLNVLVLERGPLPAGASTRNAGFACFGSASELLDDLQTQSEDDVFHLVRQRWLGLQQLRTLLGDDAIGYQHRSGYEVFLPRDRDTFEACASELPRLNRAMAEATGQSEVFQVAHQKIETFGLRGVEQLIENRAEGQIHTGKMMKCLLACAQSHGVRVLNGLDVATLQSESGRVEVTLKNGWEFSVGKVLVATNGFARRLLPELELQPARNQVMTTGPIPGLALNGCFHYDRGYVYFRDIDGRLLIGGARNLNLEGETTDQFGFNEMIFEELCRIVNEVILPDTPWTVEQRWSGIMGIATAKDGGRPKSPIMEEVANGIWVAVRLGGMGVALGTGLGQDAANAMA